MNVDGLGSESAQNAQNRVEIGCEDISLNPAQMAPRDAGGSCKLDLGFALTQTHGANGGAEWQR